MRYKVYITPGKNASAVASTIAHLNGDWSNAVDGVGNIPGIVFINANVGEDEDLKEAMDDHPYVIEYTPTSFFEQTVYQYESFWNRKKSGSK